MRALIQRVKQASVTINQHVISEIEQGLLVFIGIGPDDNLTIAKRMVDKLLGYRVFSDSNGKMSLNVQQIKGSLLLVSQFTLMAQTHKGLRPDFSQAMPSGNASVLFNELIAYAQEQYPYIKTGKFGADMQVSLVNDGPVTLLLEAN